MDSRAPLQPKHCRFLYRMMSENLKVVLNIETGVRLKSAVDDSLFYCWLLGWEHNCLSSGYLRRVDQPACSIKSGEGGGNWKMATELCGPTILGLRRHITEVVLAALWLGQISSRLHLIFTSERGELSWWHICFRHREAHSCLFSLLTSQMMLTLKQPDGLASFARNQKPRDPDSKRLKKRGGGESREMH